MSQVAGRVAATEALFVRALRVLGLVDTFKNEATNYTVFVPKDSAIVGFIRDEGISMGDLFKERSGLRYIILSHVVNTTEVRACADVRRARGARRRAHRPSSSWPSSSSSNFGFCLH